MKKSIKLRNFSDITQLVACVSFFIVYISLIAYRIEPETSFLGYVEGVSTVFGATAAMLGAAAAIKALQLWQRQVKAPVRYQLLMEASEICCRLQKKFTFAKFKKFLWEKEKSRISHYQSYPEEAVGIEYGNHLKKIKSNEDGRKKLTEYEPEIQQLLERLEDISKQIDSSFDLKEAEFNFGFNDATLLEVSVKKIKCNIDLCIKYLKYTDDYKEADYHTYHDELIHEKFPAFFKQLKVLENLL